MIQLPNGCSCSTPTVYPANWDKAKASLKVNWYIQYYFHDPEFSTQYPRGKFCQIKSGINRYKTLAERRDATHTILKGLMDKLQNCGYNPILKMDTTVIEVPDSEISPDTPFIDALRKAYARLKVVKNTKDNIGYILNHFETSAKQLRYASLPIKEISKKHVRLTIENCANVKDYWSANQFNHYRAHIGMLFGELIELETIDVNYCTAIKKEKKIVKLSRTLTDEERKEINDHLLSKYPAFWRYMHIFFHSGGRTTELLRLKVKDVNLKKQEYKALILKGAHQMEVMKPIKTIALPLWHELINGANAEDYVFSKGLVPGKDQIDPKQISKRWRLHVRKPRNVGGLGIDVDFYKLKHLNTSEVIDILSESVGIEDAESAAAKMNSHSTTQMVKKVYDTRNKMRKDELFKNVDNKFA